VERRLGRLWEAAWALHRHRSARQAGLCALERLCRRGQRQPADAAHPRPPLLPHQAARLRVRDGALREGTLPARRARLASPAFVCKRAGAARLGRDRPGGARGDCAPPAHAHRRADVRRLGHRRRRGLQGGGLRLGCPVSPLALRLCRPDRPAAARLPPRRVVALLVRDGRARPAARGDLRPAPRPADGRDPLLPARDGRLWLRRAAGEAAALRRNLRGVRGSGPRRRRRAAAPPLRARRVLRHAALVAPPVCRRGQ